MVTPVTDESPVPTTLLDVLTTIFTSTVIPTTEYVPTTPPDVLTPKHSPIETVYVRKLPQNITPLDARTSFAVFIASMFYMFLPCILCCLFCSIVVSVVIVMMFKKKPAATNMGTMNGAGGKSPQNQPVDVV